MTLQEKGLIVPPPPLAPQLQPIADSIQTWEGIIAATHWDLYNRTRPDGADFYVGEEELGHIHLNGEVHLATTNELRKPLVARGLAERFPYGGGGYAGWVNFHIHNEETARHALWLFRLNYDRIRGVALPQLLEEIEGYK